MKSASELSDRKKQWLEDLRRQWDQNGRLNFAQATRNVGFSKNYTTKLRKELHEYIAKITEFAPKKDAKREITNQDDARALLLDKLTDIIANGSDMSAVNAAEKIIKMFALDKQVVADKTPKINIVGFKAQQTYDSTKRRCPECGNHVQGTGSGSSGVSR